MKKTKNKILRFHPNGLQTKDRSYNNIKELLNKETTSVKEVINNKEYLENTLKEYLENKKYTIYLCKISFPLRLTIITSPKLLKPDLENFKHDFGLNDYESEIDLTDNVGQYYFRWKKMNSANETLRSIRQRKALLTKDKEESIAWIKAKYKKNY